MHSMRLQRVLVCARSCVCASERERVWANECGARGGGGSRGVFERSQEGGRKGGGGRQEETAKKEKTGSHGAGTQGKRRGKKMGCVNKYMLRIHSTQACRVLVVTRRNHTAEEEPDLGELSELLQNQHKGWLVWTCSYNIPSYNRHEWQKHKLLSNWYHTAHYLGMRKATQAVVCNPFWGYQELASKFNLKLLLFPICDTFAVLTLQIIFL